MTETGWFLTAAERGNPATDLDRDSPGRAWIEGNQVIPLVEGGSYFDRLVTELDRLKPGDRVYFTDWRGDADEFLQEGGPRLGDLLGTLAERGTELRGLVWRSHSDRLSFSATENQRLGAELNDAGAEVLLDQRVRLFGSHHQKLFVIQHRGDPERDVAFVGGIDLSHARRDSCRHLGDPQTQPMDPRYGPRSPWHDAALQLHGPVVGELLLSFAERWNDPHPLDRRTPYHRLVQRRARMPRHPQPLPDHFPPPPVAGPHPVQVLRTYGRRRPPYPFAPEGERSVARAHLKAFARARALIYLEDQYLWSELVVHGLVQALRRRPRLCLIAVLPRYPDADDALQGPPNRIGQLRAMDLLRRAAPDRVGFFDLENEAGTPIYVHAKLCIVDDTWLCCGSANANRRSWTNDSELSCAVVDHELARGLRNRLWREHLGDPAAAALSGPLPADPRPLLAAWQRAAEALDGWHAGGRAGDRAGDRAGGRAGDRPPGQVRPHRPAPVTRWQRLWAQPMYAVLYDPDGRPLRQRRGYTF